jgi:hypothetical protein
MPITLASGLSAVPAAAPTQAQIIAALGYTPENAANKGIANGYAPLDSGLLVPYANLPSAFETVTWATKPAAPTTGRPFWISDAGARGSAWFYDGARWKPVNNQCLLASMNTAVLGLTNSEVISFQYQTPAGLLQLKDCLMIRASLNKSGVTDTAAFRVRMGTAGTVIGDTGVFSSTVLSAAQVQGGVIHELRIETATTVQPLARSDLGYGGGTTAAIIAPITIANVSNALFIDFAAVSNSTNNTVGLVSVEMWLCAPENSP